MSGKAAYRALDCKAPAEDKDREREAKAAGRAGKGASTTDGKMEVSIYIDLGRFGERLGRTGGVDEI